MPLYNFKKYLEINRPSKILFDSANQKWSYYPLRFHLTFTEINIHFAPDLIYLRGASDDICLQCVEKVRVNDEHECYTSAVVTCKGISGEVTTFKLLLIA